MQTFSMDFISVYVRLNKRIALTRAIKTLETFTFWVVMYLHCEVITFFRFVFKINEVT